MKKTIVFSLILFSASVFSFAQNDTTSTPAKERLKQIEDMTVEKVKARRSIDEDERKFVDLNLLDHFMVGFHSMDIQGAGCAIEALPFTTPSREYALNILTFSINPTDWFSLSAGADIKWDQFGTKDKTLRFYVIEKEQYKTAGFGENFNADSYKKYKSFVKTTSFSFPLLATVHIGDFDLFGGAEYSRFINKYSRVVERYVDANGKNKNAVKDLTLLDPARSANPGKWNWLAGFTIDDLGIYFKYSPEQFADAAGFTLNYYTVGIILSM